MRDTSPEVDERMRALMTRKTPAERLSMASGMFDTARALIRAGFHGSPDQWRVYLFDRLYRNDFTADEHARILTRLGPGPL